MNYSGDDYLDNANDSITTLNKRELRYELQGYSPTQSPNDASLMKT